MTHAQRRQERNLTFQTGKQRSNSMNGRSKRTVMVAVACLNTLVALSPTGAAEITILSSRNVQPEMDAIIPAFEHSSGHKVAISYASTPEFIDRFNEGPRVDMAILYTPTMDRFLASTKIAVASRFDILQSDIGTVVRAGARSPTSAPSPHSGARCLGQDRLPSVRVRPGYTWRPCFKSSGSPNN
jgi:hypothetical protein